MSNIGNLLSMHQCKAVQAMLYAYAERMREIEEAMLELENAAANAPCSFGMMEELITYGEECNPPKKDERAGWPFAAQIAEDKQRAQIKENRKLMISEKARQSARRKKRKRFDAW